MIGEEKHNTMMVKNAIDLDFEGETLDIEDMEPTQSSTNALALLN